MPSPQSSTGADMPAKSLLARIASSFSTKVRNVPEFYITLEQPYRQYSPGDVVSGSVALKVIKPTRITHLVVCLHGYVQVYKNPGVPVDPVASYSASIGSGRAKRGGEYYGNGYASLFEHEVVQCGEGRLAEGIYRFNFELEFPDGSLPSSIDFERGTVSYMVTATLTRPTTLSPTMTCERKVFLIEDINIAPLNPVKPKVICLKPIVRGLKSKGSSRKLAANANHPRTANLRAAEGMGPGYGNGAPHDEQEISGSPVPSEVGSESRASSSSIKDLVLDSAPISGLSNEGEGPLLNRLSKSTTITAVVELLQAGCLRGDNIPLKISVSHAKNVTNVNGIILTLYRQARVDMHPALPLGSSGQGDKPKYEDYYPKSKSGLGGLSLSSAGSSHVFRKDLSQSTAPLILDPVSLRAEIKTSIRVPEEAFPTISSVPGSMISFKYYVEVVLDLHGKLVGQDKRLPSSGPAVTPCFAGGGHITRSTEDAAVTQSTAWELTFIDTENLRRDKSLAACVFEVVVGTRDSGRQKGKRRKDHNRDPYHSEIQYGDITQSLCEVALPPARPETYYLGEPQSRYEAPPTGSMISTDSIDQGSFSHLHFDNGRISTISPPRPPKFFAGEAYIPEKEWLRLHEARLLPSKPPDLDDVNHTGTEVPCAPDLNDDLSDFPQYSRPGSPYHEGAESEVQLVCYVRDDRAIAEQSGSETFAPSIVPSPAEDKTELHHQRLATNRSAPERYLVESIVSGEAVDEAGHITPSAPMLEEDEETTYGAFSAASELPKYER